jgi:hypothetical protein
MTRTVVVVFVVLTISSVSAPAGAQTIAPNACGVYVAPTSYEFKSAGSKYDLFQSNTSQDIGFFYNRLFGRTISLQIEARLSSRDMDAELAGIPARINEDLIQFPLMVHFNRVRWVDESPLRIYLGGGISYSVLLEQEIATFGDNVFPPEIAVTTDAGGYQKLAWLLDGGAAYTFYKNSGVFLSYRMSVDWTTFGESDEVPLTAKYIAFGFQGGFEWRFGNGEGTGD